MRKFYGVYNETTRLLKGEKEMKKGTYTKVYAAHETRMWIRDVIIPGTFASVIISQTEFGRKVGAKIKNVGQKIKSKFQKKE